MAKFDLFDNDNECQGILFHSFLLHWLSHTFGRTFKTKYYLLISEHVKEEWRSN